MSFKVLGTEVLDTKGRGRELQASLFVGVPPNTSGTLCGTPIPLGWANPQEAGSCDHPSNVCALNLGPSGSGEINVGTNPLDWTGLGVYPPGLRIEGNHKLGLLPYVNQKEVVRLYYHIFADDQDVTFLHTVTDEYSNDTHVPFMPAVYFRGTVLTHYLGLRMDGSVWDEITDAVYQSTDGKYKPSLFQYRSIAVMRPDLGWGVALYVRWTLTQSCNGVTYSMALPSQQGKCPNFAAQHFPNENSTVPGGVNNLSLVDQSLKTIKAKHSDARMPHVVVGNLETIQAIVNHIYTMGY